MSTPKSPVLPVALMTLLLPHFALGGAVVTLETKDLTSPTEAPGLFTIYVDGENLRMDPDVETGGTGSMIFLGASEEMIAIDHERREYVVLDEAALEGLAGEVSGMMAEMQAALAELPPEQRAMAEQMMQQRMGGMPGMDAPKAEPTIDRTGRSDSVNGVSCEVVTVSQSGRITDELCVADWSDVEGGEEAADAMKAMASFFEDVRETFSQGGRDVFGAEGDVFSNLDELGGFPVRSRHFGQSGALEDETILKSSESQSIDPSIFAAPADYSRQSMAR